MSRRRVRSLNAAAAFVDEVGIAVLFPRADLVLPSLWEAVAGPGPVEWAVRDDEDNFVSFTPEFDRIWRWKDDLPEQKLACVGKHAARAVCVVSPQLLGALYALTGRAGRPDDFRDDELDTLQREIAEVVLENGPCSGPEIRRLLGTADKRRVDTAIERLQRRLVLTNAGCTEQEQGWPAIMQDVFARRWRSRLRRLPAEDVARERLATTVLATGEVSAADLAAALSWRRREAATVLETLTERGRAVTRDEDDIRLWSST
jgi:hypothetical protein